MSKPAKDRNFDVVPASTVPYKLYRCPNEKCARTEKAGKPPFYSSCPDCSQPCGALKLVEEKPARPAKKAAKRSR